jgi:hypothetical protein
LFQGKIVKICSNDAAVVVKYLPGLPLAKNGIKPERTRPPTRWQEVDHCGFSELEWGYILKRIAMLSPRQRMIRPALLERPLMAPLKHHS